LSDVIEAVKTIRDDFRERFGVEVDIGIDIHWKKYPQRIDKELAERIAAYFEPETGKFRWRQSGEDPLNCWASVENKDLRLRICTYYDNKDVIALEMRKCPKCGLVRYSANTGPWRCKACGTEITEEHNVSGRRNEEQCD